MLVRISTIGFVPVGAGAVEAGSSVGGAVGAGAGSAGSSAGGGGEPPPQPIVNISPIAASIHFDRISLLFEKELF
jgi:hypothetical protein